MFNSEALVGLPGYEVTGIGYSDGMVCVSCRYIGECSCPFCGSVSLRSRARRNRRVRHESHGERACVLDLESRKFPCRSCQKTFWQRFPGILQGKRSSEPFRRSVAHSHRDGIDRYRLSLRERIGSATVERWFK